MSTTEATGPVRRAGAVPPRVDLLLVGGRIWTACEDLDDVPREVSALAVRAGEVVAVGSDAELGHLRADAARVLDLDGRRALPGLIDSHMHAVRAGIGWDLSMHWEGVRSLADALAEVAQRAAAAAPGEWLCVVGGWHARQLAEGRSPTRAELDAAAPHHPVYVQELYDRGMLNTAGLRACGWDDSSPDPARGSLARDATGALTGAIHGVGAFSVPIGLALAPSHEQAVSGTRAMFRELATHGLTGVGDGGGLLITPSDYRALYDVWRSGDLDVRVRLFMSAWERGAEVENIRSLTAIAGHDFGDDMLRVSGVGEIPHLGCHDMEGLDPFTLTEAAHAELVEIVRTCVDTGWRMSIHAVRDATLGRVLDAFEEADGGRGLLRDAHFSVVHADEASDANLDRLARLGVGVMVQNRLLLKATDYVREWGRDAVLRTPPIGAMRSRGITIGGGSDSTRANWFHPWPSIAWLVDGAAIDDAPARAPEHRLDVAQALATYTRDAAWFTGEERHRGRLAPGYAADVCVPTLDPFTADPAALAGIRSDLTLLGGRVTHAAGDFAAAAG